MEDSIIFHFPCITISFRFILPLDYLLGSPHSWLQEVIRLAKSEILGTPRVFSFPPAERCSIYKSMKTRALMVGDKCHANQCLNMPRTCHDLIRSDILKS